MSSNSARSRRVKQEARTRPDVVWQDQDGYHEEIITDGLKQEVLSGGSELGRLISEADTNQVAMRKIVQ